MALRLTQLDETNRAAFEALLAQAWRQNWGPELARALVRWRYYDRPSGGGTWLTFDGGQCVAMLDSFVRPYLLDGRRVLVRESCDWYCLPKYRPLGVGIRLMREMMACPEPMLSVGGTAATVSILPRLGWTKLPNAGSYFLPIKARGLAGALLRNRWPEAEAYAKAIPAFIALQRPRRARAPPIGVSRVAERRPGAPAASAVAQDHRLLQLLDQAEEAWLTRMPRGVAEVLGLTFFIDEAPVGFSFSQVEPVVTGLDGRIVHLQIAHPQQAVADWVVAETASRLAARGVGIIRCLASAPEKIGALSKAGFLLKGPVPGYWWPQAGLPTPLATDVGFLHADHSVPLATLHGRHRASALGVPQRELSSPSA